jgi:hypothetical protein
MHAMTLQLRSIGLGAPVWVQDMVEGGYLALGGETSVGGLLSLPLPLPLSKPRARAHSQHSQA